jgi:ketosteroid isomerase-like protein
MSRPPRPWRTLAVALAIALAACGGPSSPRTAEEFIEAYAAAYRDKDVDAIMALRYDPNFARKAGVRADLARDIDAYNAAQDREEVEGDLATGGQWATAWASTRFVSERPHGNHIHVTVKIRDVPPMELVVLVRDGDSLKIHTRPSSVD